MGSFAGKPGSGVVEVVVPPPKGDAPSAITGGSAAPHQVAKPATSSQQTAGGGGQEPPAIASQKRNASLSFKPSAAADRKEGRTKPTSAEALVARSQQQAQSGAQQDAFHVNSRLLEPSSDELHVALGDSVLSEAEEDAEMQVAIAASLQSAEAHKAGELRRLPPARPRTKPSEDGAGRLSSARATARQQAVAPPGQAPPRSPGSPGSKEKDVLSSPNTKVARRPPPKPTSASSSANARNEAGPSAGSRPPAIDAVGGSGWVDNSDFGLPSNPTTQVRPPASSRSASCGPRPGGAMRSGIVSLPRIQQTLPASQQAMVKDLHEQIQVSGPERSVSYAEQRARRGAVDRAAERVLTDQRAHNRRGDSSERVDVQALLEGMDLDLPTAAKGVSSKALGVASKQEGNFNDRFASSAIGDSNNRNVRRVQQPLHDLNMGGHNRSMRERSQIGDF